MKQTSIGIRLYASESEPTVQNESGYAALSWTEIGEITDLPDYGPTTQVIESNALKFGVTQKFPGSTNYGSLAIGMDLDPDDTGQQFLEGSLSLGGIRKSRSFRIKLKDTFNEYFQGMITSNVRGASGNSMVSSTVNTEINTKITRAVNAAGTPNNALTSGADYLTFNGAFLTYSL
jgi:hypothetical protein